MMISKSFLLLLLVLCVSAFGILHASSTEYWISFTGIGPDTPGPSVGGSKYLLKIDNLGNVIIQARRIVNNSATYKSSPSGATALSLHNGLVQMWIHGRSSGFLQPLFRAVIRKNTLQLKSVRNTGLTSAD